MNVRRHIWQAVQHNPQKPTLPQATLLTRTVATKIFVIVIDTRGIKCQ